MQALNRYKPRPLETYTPVSQRSKYQFIRMKDMLRSALGAPPNNGSIFSAVTPGGAENMGTARSLAMGMMGAPSSATNENFPNSAGGMGGYATPMSAGLDGPSGGGGMNLGSRRQSSMSIAMPPNNNGPRHILPSQIPGPGQQQRKSSVASVASMGPS